MLKLTERNPGVVAFEGSPLARLMRVRGLVNEKDVHAFLHPEASQLQDPMLLNDMAQAVDLLHRAREEQWPTCVYGDYDVDGVSATALLTGFLNEWGLKTTHYIPSRHDEGYGLNEHAIREIAGYAHLLITVDCGISDATLIALARNLGMEAIVTDHHRPGDVLPGCPVVNPLLADYPFPSLCGAGVAFKLASALDAALALPYIDLAALATVADIVPLTGENRVLVSLGLDRINRTPRPGLRALIECAGLAQGSVRAGHIAFQLAPRLNASGRIGDAGRALRLLKTADPDEALALARELEEENLVRRRVTQEILDQAEEQLCRFDFARRKIIVLCGAGWNPGVVGLAASRLVEKYNYPVILLAQEGDVLTGSCRSIPGVDIFEVLCTCAHRLTRFGGHKQAAGLTMPLSELDGFIKEVNRYVAEHTNPECYVPSIAYDMTLPLDALDDEFARELELFQPTGFGNPSPLFLTEAYLHDPRAIGANGAHLRMTLEQNGARRAGIGFSMGAQAWAGSRRVLYAPGINNFRGVSTLQCEVKALLPSDYLSALRATPEEWLCCIHSFLTERLYNKDCSTLLAANMDEDQLIQRIKHSTSGLLIVAVTRDAALSFLARLTRESPPDRLDVYAGRWPEDPRPFNALCLAPVGVPPDGFDCVALLDAPAALLGDLPGAHEPLCTPYTTWLRNLPDVDALRRLYTVARTLLGHSGHASLPFERLISALCGHTGLDVTGVLCGLMALDDMQLVSLTSDPASLRMLPMHKSIPEQSALYQRITLLRKWGGEHS